ncbi:MAG: hypothetical protein KDK22_17545, partial [Rhodobacteraceae bacterium]|nr:hypothetical protein [Paracoccaceae bacterium]
MCQAHPRIRCAVLENVGNAEGKVAPGNRILRIFDQNAGLGAKSRCQIEQDQVVPLCGIGLIELGIKPLGQGAVGSGEIVGRPVEQCIQSVGALTIRALLPRRWGRFGIRTI